MTTTNGLADWLISELEALRDEIYETWHPVNHAVTLKDAGEDALCQVSDLLAFAAEWDTMINQQCGDEFCPKHERWFSRSCPTCQADEVRARAIVNAAFVASADDSMSFDAWIVSERRRLYAIDVLAQDEWKLLHAIDCVLGF